LARSISSKAPSIYALIFRRRSLRRARESESSPSCRVVAREEVDDCAEEHREEEALSGGER
jgi:hypothetical protein